MTINVIIGGKKFLKKHDMKKTPDVTTIHRDEVFNEEEAPETMTPTLVTLRMAFDIFIDENKDKYATSTLEQYAHLRDKHFQDIMDVWVMGISEETIQTAFDNEIKRGWSKNTLKKYKTCLLNVLKEPRPDFHPKIVIDK